MALNELKDILTRPQMQDFLSFDREFTLKTDAIGFAFEAIPSNADDRLKANASKTLNEAKKNYCTTANKTDGNSIFCWRFCILTDYRLIVYLYNISPNCRLRPAKF